MSQQQPTISEDGKYYWDGTQWLPRPVSMLVPAVIVIVGTVVVVLGEFLPWVTASSQFGVTVSLAGYQTDGIWLGGLAVLTAGFTVLGLLRDPSKFVVALLGLLAAAALVLLVWVGSEVGTALKLTQVDLYTEQVGPGIFVSGAGVVVTLIGAIVAGVKVLL